MGLRRVLHALATLLVIAHQGLTVQASITHQGRDSEASVLKPASILSRHPSPDRHAVEVTAEAEPRPIVRRVPAELVSAGGPLLKRQLAQHDRANKEIVEGDVASQAELSSEDAEDAFAGLHLNSKGRVSVSVGHHGDLEYVSSESEPPEQHRAPRAFETPVIFTRTGAEKSSEHSDSAHAGKARTKMDNTVAILMALCTVLFSILVVLIFLEFGSGRFAQALVSETGHLIDERFNMAPDGTQTQGVWLPDSDSDEFDGQEEMSIKMKVAQAMPMINDADTFREARQVLRDLGGAAALRKELVNLGIMLDTTGELTTADVPFNIFASLAAGKKVQDDMKQEQEALGTYRDRFLVCRNLKERDELWNSSNTEAMRVASMSRVHRMMTTKDLNWQWFNVLVLGMVPGGVSSQRALEEIEAMRDAALHYAKTSGKYSGEVGLYLNCYGHCEVNALFVHILDMDALGPSFKLHRHKNCHIDAILEVLREEAASSAEGKSV